MLLAIISALRTNTMSQLRTAAVCALEDPLLLQGHMRTPSAYFAFGMMFYWYATHSYDSLISQIVGYLLKKVNRWASVGPYFFRTFRCSRVPYPLCSSKPYSGYFLASLVMYLSRTTFAIIEAIIIGGCFSSPLMIVFAPYSKLFFLVPR